MQLTVREAAKLLGVPVSTVHRWIRDRGLPAVLFNEQYRLNAFDLQLWAQVNQVAIDPSELAAREPATQQLATALGLGGIHRDLPGDDRQQVLLAAVGYLPVPVPGDREMLLQILTAREHQGSTAIGNGIAIPHARHPIILAQDQPVLSLCFLRHPVDFGASDGKPVHTLFTMITPTIRVHLQFLARLAFALTTDFGRAVAARADDQAILAALRAAEQAAADKKVAPGGAPP